MKSSECFSYGQSEKGSTSIYGRWEPIHANTAVNNYICRWTTRSHSTVWLCARNTQHMDMVGEWILIQAVVYRGSRNVTDICLPDNKIA